MFRIEENDREIIIKEFPVNNWLGFLFTFCVGIYIIYTGLLDIIGIEIPSIAIFLTITALSGLMAYISYPVVKIQLDKEKNLLKISRENLIKNEYKIFSLKQIENEILVEERKATFNEGFQLFLPLKNGDKIKLSSLNGSKQKEYIEIAERLNTIISNTQKQIP